MKSSFQSAAILGSILALLLFACAPQTIKTDSVVIVEVTPESPEEFDAEFTLKTVTDRGKLAFLGVGGEIDGIINPDLVVQPGEVVRVILVNGDGMPHDLSLPDWETKTDYVSKIGAQTEIVLEVGEKRPGTYAYYCTVPGHRQAGQEGKLIVGEASE